MDLISILNYGKNKFIYRPNQKAGKKRYRSKGNSRLEEFFTDSLKDLWAEKHLTKALIGRNKHGRV